MDVQLSVTRRGKQQLFTGVKVVPPEKVITLSTLRKLQAAAQERIQLIHGKREDSNPLDLNAFIRCVIAQCVSFSTFLSQEEVQSINGGDYVNKQTHVMRTTVKIRNKWGGEIRV